MLYFLLGVKIMVGENHGSTIAMLLQQGIHWSRKTCQGNWGNTHEIQHPIITAWMVSDFSCPKEGSLKVLYSKQTDPSAFYTFACYGCSQTKTWPWWLQAHDIRLCIKQHNDPLIRISNVADTKSQTKKTEINEKEYCKTWTSSPDPQCQHPQT